MGTKGNRPRVAQFKNEYGLLFVFSDKVFGHIAELKGLRVSYVKDFAILYYIQRYIIGSRLIIITKLSQACKDMGFNYSNNYVNRRINLFNEMGLTDYFGKRHHFNDNASNFLKSYAYWFHFYMVNFYSLMEKQKACLRPQSIERVRRKRKRNKKNIPKSLHE